MTEITAVYGALLTALFLVLCGRLSATRMNLKISNGDGGNKVLAKRVRAQANFAEYVPLCLLLVFVLEFGGQLQRPVLHGLGATLFLARLAHAYNMAFDGHFAFRFYSTAVQYVYLFVLVILLLYTSLRTESFFGVSKAEL